MRQRAPYRWRCSCCCGKGLGRALEVRPIMLPLPSQIALELATEWRWYADQAWYADDHRGRLRGRGGGRRADRRDAGQFALVRELPVSADRGAQQRAQGGDRAALCHLAGHRRRAQDRHRLPDRRVRRHRRHRARPEVGAAGRAGPGPRAQGVAARFLLQGTPAWRPAVHRDRHEGRRVAGAGGRHRRRVRFPRSAGWAT